MTARDGEATEAQLAARARLGSRRTVEIIEGAPPATLRSAVAEPTHVNGIRVVRIAGSSHTIENERVDPLLGVTVVRADQSKSPTNPATWGGIEFGHDPEDEIVIENDDGDEPRDDNEIVIENDDEIVLSDAALDDLDALVEQLGYTMVDPEE